MKSVRLLFLLVILSFGFTSQAKDLASRLGVGYRNSLVSFPDLASIATIYYPSPDIGLVGSLGVDTQDQNSKFAAAAGIRRIIFKEDNMNFFGAGQIAIVNQEIATRKSSGFELAATVGGEFFLPGLESLGFNFETGMGVTTVEKTRFRTLGESFLTAGMIFYF